MLTNAKIKEIQKLTEKSKARREAGLFVIEGPRMFIETPLEWIEEIYVTQRFLDNADSGLSASTAGSVENSHSDYSTSIRASEMITWMNHEVVTEEQMKKLTDTVTPQGILCVVRQPSYTMEDIINHPGHRLIMILEDIQDPGNLGTIFRTAEGAGASGIIMTKGCADLFNPKVVRSTMGSIYRVPFFVTDDI